MRYVALWRGINVGKAKRLAMADLKALKTAAEWAAIAAANPIAEADDPSRLLVAIPADAAALQAAAGIVADSGERFVVTADAAYLWCGNGILESKAAVLLLKKLGESGTTRNWATVGKLNALANP